MLIRGRALLFGDDVSTDILMPGALAFGHADAGPEELAALLPAALRPSWMQRLTPSTVIVAGRNFGCGSGRPAPRLLKRCGVMAVLAESLARQFFRNAIHSGLPALGCRGVLSLFAEGEVAELEVETGRLRNLDTGDSLFAEALPPGSPPSEILAAGGIDAYLLATWSQQCKR